MDWIVIDGVPPYEGRWQFDLDSQELTTREWGWIKRLSGYLPLTVEEGLSDPELIVVFACIALRRAGKATPAEVPDVFEQLSDAPFGSTVRMETDQKEAAEEASPPASSSNENGDSSGDGSKTSSETSPPTPTVSGTPVSDTSESARPTLVSSPQAS